MNTPRYGPTAIRDMYRHPSRYVPIPDRQWLHQLPALAGALAGTPWLIPRIYKALTRNRYNVPPPQRKQPQSSQVPKNTYYRKKRYSRYRKKRYTYV